MWRLLRGTLKFNSGIYTLTAKNGDIGGTYDELFFAYQTKTVNNFSLISRVIKIDSLNDGAQAGIVVRQNLNTGTKSVSLGITNSLVSFQYRTAGGGQTTSVNVPIIIGSPYWLKLIRNVSSFTGLYSQDGINFIEVGKATVSMTNATSYSGIFVTSNGTDNDATGTFENLTGWLAP